MSSGRVARFGEDISSVGKLNTHALGSNMFRTINILKTSLYFRSCIHPSSRSFVHSLPRSFPRIGRFTSEKSFQSTLPTFRDQVARSIEVESFSSRFPRPTIRNQVLVSKFHSFFTFVLELAGSWFLSFLSVDLYSRIQ
jgi:hypothetical protein